MTITFSPRDENKPVDLLEETQKLYQHTAQELMAAVNLIKEGNLDQVKAATIAVKELRQALTWAMEERASFEKRNKGIAGAVGSDTLDLDAARDEIGRRLARLRDAERG
jgi:hypothetical protein